jgi:phage baseplate assembly protein W
MVTKAFAIEDGNQETRSLVTSRNRLYKDIDLELNIRPTGDVFKKSDAAAVKQSVKTILLTNFGEKPFLPSFGANLHSLLFELVDEQIEDSIEIAVRQAIKQYEPRAVVNRVRVQALSDNNTVSVQVEYTIISTSETVITQVSIARVR